MVFNKVTYPKLTNLFEELNVPVQPSDMSFSVQYMEDRLEYAGASFGRLFGQRKNLLSPRFWRMLTQLDRFNKEAIAALDDRQYDHLTVEQFVSLRGYGSDFLELYLLPMSSAVWSAPPGAMRGFPAKTLMRFFHNHGFLGMDTQHQWWTVKGGSRAYVDKLLQAAEIKVKLTNPVKAIVCRSHGADVITDDGARRHDKVIIAAHADEALQLLQPADPLVRSLLSPFKYQPNSATLHTDSSIMPHTRRCWSSWNYRIDKKSASTHYWMNSLQKVSQNQDYFVSINAEHLLDQTKILKRFHYHHPLFSQEAVKAQSDLPMLNARSPSQSLYFCGSYFRYGFHEDALMSGILAAEQVSASGVPV
jgi:predicted NAD/FAD-binding protein